MGEMNLDEFKKKLDTWTGKIVMDAYHYDGMQYYGVFSFVKDDDNLEYVTIHTDSPDEFSKLLNNLSLCGKLLEAQTSKIKKIAREIKLH